MKSRMTYRACGINFESELDLPGIPLAAENRSSASVRFGRIPVNQSKNLTGENWYDATPQRLEFLIPNIGRYLVTGGRDILIDPVSGTSNADLRVFLMGSAFGGLLHQRGILPLHASTVRVSDSYVAFMGNSGDGKSTQAAVLHHSGYPLAGDDICPVTIGSNGTIVADAGFPRLKLWSDALEALQIEHLDMERLSVGHDKYELAVCDLKHSEPLPLRALYLLEYVEDENSIGIEPMRGQSSLPHLLQHTYRYCFLNGLGSIREHFQACTRLANSVPIFRLRRIRDLAFFSETVEMLERHWNQRKPKPE